MERVVVAMELVSGEKAVTMEARTDCKAVCAEREDDLEEWGERMDLAAKVAVVGVSVGLAASSEGWEAVDWALGAAEE